jgi:AcrR family transcriptional regulator
MQHAQRPDTKAALIRAAERLFAEKGLGGVSVKEITRSAGARNESALHYHFGGLEALIREVFAKRYREIEAARTARLEAVASGPSEPTLEAVLETSMLPFMEACQEESGRLYARFCVQLATDPRFDIGTIISEIGMTSLVTMRNLLVRHLGHIPGDILAARLRQALVIGLVQAADYARRIELGGAPSVEAATREAALTLSGYMGAWHAG